MLKLSFAGSNIAEVNGSILAYAAALSPDNPLAPAKLTAPKATGEAGAGTPSGTVADAGISGSATISTTAPTAASLSDELDAAGIAWDAAKHAGTKAKVASGLWRMKVGVKRAEGEGEDSPKYAKPGAGSAPVAGPSVSSAPPAPIAAPAVDPNRPTDAAFRHDNGDGTEQWAIDGAWDGGKHPIPAAAPPAPPAAPVADVDDEFAQFATAAGAAPAAPAVRNWTDADLGKLSNQAAVKDGHAERVKAIIVKYVPTDQQQHSRNIPADVREAFAQEVESTIGITYAG